MHILMALATPWQLYLACFYWLARLLPFGGVGMRLMDVATSWLAGLCRLGVGRRKAGGRTTMPSRQLRLYIYEGCPFCRLVVETLSVLGTPALILPTPRISWREYGLTSTQTRHRLEARRIGGRVQFPLLVDPNHNLVLYESAAIIDHLWNSYGAEATPPLAYRLLYAVPTVNLLLSALASFLRPLPWHGHLKIPARTPAKPLQLYGHANGVHFKLVCEKLTCLEIPFVLMPTPMGGDLRSEYFQRFGHRLGLLRRLAGVPKVLLVDPNTGAELFQSLDSDRILPYLANLYQLGEPPAETFLNYSTTGATATHSTLGNKRE